MKIKELKQILEQCDENLDVIGSWEGIDCDIWGIFIDKEQLVLDVDNGTASFGAERQGIPFLYKCPEYK